MFPNRIKKAGGKMKPGPMRYEEILARKVQPVADRLGLPHLIWRLIRHWGSTQMIGNKVDAKVVQQRLGHSRPDIGMRHYAHALDERADQAADLVSGQLGYQIPAEFAVNPVDV
jgi:integrase